VQPSCHPEAGMYYYIDPELGGQLHLFCARCHQPLSGKANPIPGKETLTYNPEIIAALGLPPLQQQKVQG
jgi:hypothetical protein